MKTSGGNVAAACTVTGEGSNHGRKNKKELCKSKEFGKTDL